ncbi:MAG: carbohydrate ABC transporter permease [Treponema sp.]|jgi:multiple sugar transport system permease protein|nr:carbohydrate ABC transporter permease [Treponema sp.]
MSVSDQPMKRYLIHALMIFLGLLAVIPVYVLLINATRTVEQINTGLSLLPGQNAFWSSTKEVFADWGKEPAKEPESVSTDEYTEGQESVEEPIQVVDASQIRFGTVKYLDLIPGITLKEELNSKTGKTEKRVIKVLTESRLPRIVIVDVDDNVIGTFLLTDRTILYVNDGDTVERGQLLAKSIRLPNVLNNWRTLTGRGFKIWQGFGNSAFVAVFATLLSVYFSAFTAYGLHIYRFKGRTAIWAIILVIMMLPGSLTFIGFYQLMVTWRLTNTYIPLILPGIAAAATVLFIRQYMTSVLNMELIDAARIDGAGEFRIFNIIIFPVIIPALAAQSIFTFVGSWNNYLLPAVILSNEKLATLPILIMSLRGDIYRTDVGAIYLGISCSLIPIIIFYSFMSRFIISGLTMGSIKE